MSIKQCNVIKDNHQDYFLLGKYVGERIQIDHLNIPYLNIKLYVITIL